MRKLLILAATALCLALGTPALAQTCRDIHNTGDGCAPSPFDGDSVQVSGVVYVTAGTYNSGSVYFQCGDGGLLFFESGAPYALGDEIEVVGIVGAFGTEIQLNGAGATILSAGNPVTPLSLTTGELGAGGDFMGNFVEIEGTLVSKDFSGTNDRYTVDDGSGGATLFRDATTGINEGLLDSYIGGVIRVRGASRCESSVLPRSDADIVLVEPPPPPPPPPTVTCAEAHATDAGDGCAPSLLEGEQVTMSGVVYVEAGTYNSGSVYFQCSGGGGMTFFEFSASYALGDEIEVVGTVGDFSGEIQLEGTMVTVLSSGNPITPEPMATGDLAAGGDFIGAFAELHAVLVSKDFGGFNAGYTLDDGTGPVTMFVDGTTGMDQSRLDALVGHVVRVKGSTKCFQGLLEILPRFDDDIEPVQVRLDIRPEGCPNSFGGNSRGLLTAAILGSDALDVNDIDASTLELIGVPVKRTGVEKLESETAAPCDCTPAASNNHPDLTLKFESLAIKEAIGPVMKDEERELILIGRFLDGTLFSAGDCVTLRGNIKNGDGEETKYRIGGEPSDNATVTRSGPPVLQDNVPNPFNPTTTIAFELFQPGNVRLEVFDMGGRRVRTLIDGASYAPGYHTTTWDGRTQMGTAVPSGVYVYRLRVGGYTTSKRMILLK